MEWLRKGLFFALSLIVIVGCSSLSTTTTNVSANTGLSASPSSLDFGSVSVNTAGSATITLKNGGHKSISILRASASLPEITVTGPSLPTLVAEVRDISGDFPTGFGQNLFGNSVLWPGPDLWRDKNVAIQGIGTPPTSTSSGVTGVTISPTSPSVQSGQTVQFSDTVQGTASNTSVTWTASVGNISASGLFTAPASAGTATVTARSNADSSKSASTTVTVNSATVKPSITTPPASQTVTAGQTASFGVAATGTAPLSYQWYRNGTAISGAASSSYTTATTTTSDNGAQFTVVVSNTAGTATSSAATLTVNSATVKPSITTPPASQTVTAGQTASFGVAATGTAPLSYQWYRNGTAISGAASSSYTTATTTTSDNGAQFTVVVSNTAGTATSSAATLSVTAVQPQISVVPGSVSFGSVTMGTTNTQTMTVSNSRSANLTLSQVTVSGSGFGFSGPALPMTLAPGQSTAFTVSFTPTSTNSATGTFAVASNAPALHPPPPYRSAGAVQQRL